jgi:hypothetical protein
VDEYRAYAKALDEITYNLQESQDFFDASLDGRLKNYHQLEKCMIEAQLQAPIFPQSIQLSLSLSLTL